MNLQAGSFGSIETFSFDFLPMLAITPNVVSFQASILVHFRTMLKYDGIMGMYEIANKMAEGCGFVTIHRS